MADHGSNEDGVKLFTWYVVTERGAKVAPLPKFILRFFALLLLCCGAFLVAGASGDSWLLRIVLSLSSLASAASAELDARSTIEFTKEGVHLRNGWRRKTISGENSVERVVAALNEAAQALRARLRAS